MEEIDPPDSEEIERLWNETPNQPPLGIMSDTDIRKAQLEHKRKYHRNYYHNHKALCGCEICGSVYISISSLRRHQGRSKKCMVQKLAKQVDELKGKLADNTNQSH